MRYHADTGYPFDTENHAYQRMLTVNGEHLRALAWNRDDGRPVMLTLYDLATGDALTRALLDSIEASHAHPLLAVHRDGTLSVHGPFDGGTAAERHAFPDADVDCRIVPMHLEVTVARAVLDGDGGHD
ncbi:hypothetical protein ACN27G_29210 [Plantactinospora sp. WMMB334]|uniref:hypothetical protein n=1 Tax=Plantactinospora sp. WMMB334 TaxID=3404119 RepID=UPI003B963E0C